MKIRQGAYYRTRGDDKNPGQVFGPMRYRKEKYCWYIGGGLSWDAKGHFDGDQQSTLDLISEVYVSDTPPADAPAPETKTMRDEFAMRIVAAFLSRPLSDNELTLEQCQIVWDNADAMMKARKK
jgi:hypothetical protein